MTSSSPGSTSSADDLATVLQQQSETLRALTDELKALREIVTNNASTTSSPSLPSSFSSSKLQEIRATWARILSYKVNDPSNDLPTLLKSFGWGGDPPFDQLFSGKRTWNSVGYRVAYPKLYDFLQKSAATEASRSKVLIKDSSSSSEHATRISTGLLKLRPLWEVLKNRVNIDKDGHITVPSRMAYITDISSSVATMVLASTPSIDLTIVAPALERHLKFSNYGQVNLYHAKAASFPGDNSFTFEYHFAVFFSPKAELTRNDVFADFRGLRRATSFSPDGAEPCRWIYEEQLSFFLTGHGRDVLACYQLADRYFVDPTAKDNVFGSVFQPFLIPRDSDDWSPTSIFLTWILRTLMHVLRRWQGAIEAIDSRIVTPADIIFSETNPDLLSDDPQFSRSRTYFWALQAYQLFEARLNNTIDAWRTFEETHLPKLHDGKISDAEFQSTLQQIQVRVDRLNDCVVHVQERMKDVESLRAGLFGASALFDSRTSIRQNDNIRLLTYITILFLPLSFGTSIFGMQVILPSLPVKVFIITIPTIFVFTFLLTFNLQNVIDIFEVISQSWTKALRRRMTKYGHLGWPQVAHALDEDRLNRKVPIRKVPRLSTHWMYLIFVLETPIILIPVHEIRWFVHILRRCHKYIATPAASTPSDEIELGKNGTSLATRVRVVEAAREEEASETLRPWLTRLLHVSHFIICTLRTLLLLLWLALLTIDYLVLLIYALLYVLIYDAYRVRTSSLTVRQALLMPGYWLGLFDYIHTTSEDTSHEHRRGRVVVTPAPAAPAKASFERTAYDGIDALRRLSRSAERSHIAPPISLAIEQPSVGTWRNAVHSKRLEEEEQVEKGEGWRTGRGSYSQPVRKRA